MPTSTSRDGCDSSPLVARLGHGASLFECEFAEELEEDTNLPELVRAAVVVPRAARPPPPPLPPPPLAAAAAATEDGALERFMWWGRGLEPPFLLAA